MKKILFASCLILGLLLTILPHSSFAANVNVILDTISGESSLVVQNKNLTSVASIDSTGNINIASGSRYKINGTTLDATAVRYVSASFETVGAALNYLLYVNPLIPSFTNNRNEVEIGTTITSTTLNWTLNKAMTSESLNQGIGSLTPPTLTTYTHTSSYTTDRTYTLTASDGTSTATADTNIYFRYSRYWGYSSSTSLISSQINALSHELGTSRSQTRTISPSAGYIYIAYPAAWGTATFTVNGLPNTDWTLSVQSHTNASGNTSSYNVYRTNNLLTGTYTIVVN